MLKKLNHTQVSNDFIDDFMKELSGEAVKIFIAISRKTIGWHKDRDRISYSQLLKLTGIKSVNGLKNGIKQLLDNKIIIQEKQQLDNSNINIYYEINYISQDDTLSQNDTDLIKTISRNDTLLLKTLSQNDTTKDKYKKNNINKMQFYEVVFLLDSEYQSLISKYGKQVIDNTIFKLNNYLLSIGKPLKYKHHYRTILNWVGKKEIKTTISKYSDKDFEVVI
jgi:phage replication O-like protein O